MTKYQIYHHPREEQSSARSGYLCEVDLPVDVLDYLTVPGSVQQNLRGAKYLSINRVDPPFSTLVVIDDEDGNHFPLLRQKLERFGKHPAADRPTMRRYVLFAAPQCYPLVGVDDFAGSFDTIQEVVDELTKYSQGQPHRLHQERMDEFGVIGPDSLQLLDTVTWHRQEIHYKTYRPVPTINVAAFLEFDKKSRLVGSE